MFTLNLIFKDRLGIVINKEIMLNTGDFKSIFLVEVKLGNAFKFCAKSKLRQAKKATAKNKIVFSLFIVLNLTYSI